MQWWTSSCPVNVRLHYTWLLKGAIDACLQSVGNSENNMVTRDCIFREIIGESPICMMTSSNGNIFHVTGPLCGKFTGEFPSQRPVTRSFDVFPDLCLNKRLSKQSRHRWFETPTRSLWRPCNGKTDSLFMLSRKALYIQYRPTKMRTFVQCIVIYGR